MPAAGHCSSAATSASCASSSARPMSRTSPVRPAMIRADSSRHTASTARCAAAVSLRAEYLADVTLAVADDGPEPPGQLQRLVLGPHLDQREADDHLLGLGERPVGQRDAPAGRDEVRTAVQAAGREQYPGPGQLLDEASHLAEELPHRRGAAALDRHEETHKETPPKNKPPAVSIQPVPVRSVSRKREHEKRRT